MSLEWWLVRWRKHGGSTTRTNWHNKQADAATTARTEQERGNEILDYRKVSGNGKRK